MGDAGKRVAAVSLSGVLFLLTGCGDGADVSGAATQAARVESAPADTGRRALACELVQAGFEAGRPLPDIDRMQRQLRGDQLSLPRRLEVLERLGWRHLELASTTFDAGYLKLAEQAGQCINAVLPNAAAAQLLSGRALHQQHRFAEAEVLARALVAKRGGWFDYGLLGDLRLEQGDAQTAAWAYQRMMDLHPGPQAYSRAAELRWMTGDAAGAIEMMALSARSTSPREPQARAWALSRLAAFLSAQGDTPAAFSLLKTALDIQPDYPPAQLLSGRLLLAQGQHDAAIAALQSAARQAPQPLYQWPLLEALQQAGKTAAAAEIVADLARRGADGDRRTFALYLASTSADPLALTLAQQEYALRQDPLTLDTLALAYWRQGNLDEAWRLMSQALEFGMRDPRLLLHAAVIGASRGDCHPLRDWQRSVKNPHTQLLPSEQRMLATEACETGPQASTLAQVVRSQKAQMRP